MNMTSLPWLGPNIKAQRTIQNLNPDITCTKASLTCETPLGWSWWPRSEGGRQRGTQPVPALEACTVAHDTGAQLLWAEIPKFTLQCLAGLFTTVVAHSRVRCAP